MFRKRHYYFISFVYINNGALNFRNLYIGIRGQLTEHMIDEIYLRLAEEHDTDYVAILDITPIAPPRKRK